MARSRVELSSRYKTAPQVRTLLGLSRFAFDLRLSRGVFPQPTLVANGIRYFDDRWVKIAKLLLNIRDESE